MKLLRLAAAISGLLLPVFAASSQSTILSTGFKPPQVFRNVNLVHIISLEKNYAKEQINIAIENISKEPQQDYFLPFTTAQISRVGGFEVKDRKDDSLGPFVAEAVEYDSESDTQYYRIRLPSPLKAGAQQTLGISFYYLDAYRPLPAAIDQDEAQYLVHDFSVFAPSAYKTSKQKTEVKCASAKIPDFTKVDKFPQQQGTKLTYGPFDEKPAGAVSPAQVRFEFAKPIMHVSKLHRELEVSHWGGNVAFEERYILQHRGAKLSKPFDRAQWTQSQYFKRGSSSALRELRVPLQIGSADAYFTDVIGNVSTSHFRSNKREALLELKPRYPVFGGWKYPFTIGWNMDAANILRRTASGGNVLRVPFLEGPKQVEGVEYERVNLRVLLPEGAENVKFYTNLPQSSITGTSVDLVKTYLDTIGRTSVTINAVNLVDEFRDRHLMISYDIRFLSSLRKPMVIFASSMALYVMTWAVGHIQVGFSKR